MRKIGEKILVSVWGFLCDLVELVACIYSVALKPKKGVALKARAICAAIAAVLTIGVIVKLFYGSFICSGLAYGAASIEKHIAILWASEKGDWYHWMTGGRYNFFKAFKEDLISTDAFASFLNSLAGKGIFLKVVQIGLIIFCYACAMFLIYIAFKCIRNFVYSIRAMIRIKAKKRANKVHTSQNDNGKVLNMHSCRHEFKRKSHVS